MDDADASDEFPTRMRCNCCFLGGDTFLGILLLLFFPFFYLFILAFGIQDQAVYFLGQYFRVLYGPPIVLQACVEFLLPRDSCQPFSFLLVLNKGRLQQQVLQAFPNFVTGVMDYVLGFGVKGLLLKSELLNSMLAYDGVLTPRPLKLHLLGLQEVLRHVIL